MPAGGHSIHLAEILKRLGIHLPAQHGMPPAPQSLPQQHLLPGPGAAEDNSGLPWAQAARGNPAPAPNVSMLGNAEPNADPVQAILAQLHGNRFAGPQEPIHPSVGPGQVQDLIARLFQRLGG